MDLKLRCSASGCDCSNFSAAASKESLRICDSCSHSWITHLLEKLLTSRDDALSVFDVCSLALYGTHALPIRLKIVIERLLATLQPDEIDKILRSFGWTPQDLARGYMIQDPRGGILTRWFMLPKEEEILILQQFLRFGPTRTLSFSLLREDFPMPPAPSANNQNSLNNVLASNNSPNLNLHVNANLTLNNSHNNNTNSSSNLMSPKNSLTPTIPRGSSHLTTMTQLGVSVPTTSHNSLTNSSPNNNHVSHHDRHNDRNHSHSHLNLSTHSSLNKSGDGNHKSHDRTALNLSRIQSESEDEDRESEMNMSLGRGNMDFDEVVDLSSTNDSKKSPGSGGGGGGHNLMSSGGGILNNLNSSLINNHSSSLEKNSSSYGGRHVSRDSRLRLQNNHQNNLISNLNNFNKSTDLMAAAAAAAAAVNSQHQVLNASSHSHSRKPQQPVKRPWNPLPTPSTLVNPATGKRRVQCSVCLKTFCDKGALKIHFSAVHLREMHKCTVAGCSMMFSSRRSRNRHSANPNPKLHSPHLRRKISPHDGRSCQPLINLNNPMLFSSSPMRFPNFLPGVGMSANGMKSGDNQTNADGSREDRSSDDEAIELKHLKLDRDLMDPDGSISENSFGSSDNEDEGYQMKSPPSSVGNNKKDGARKRKLTNPVRLPSVPDDSNDDFCCYDDGTEVSHEDEEIEYGEEMKKVKKAPSSSSLDDRDRDSHELEDKSTEKCNSNNSKSKYSSDLEYQGQVNCIASPTSASEKDLKIKDEIVDAINLSGDAEPDEGIKADIYSEKTSSKRRKSAKDLTNKSEDLTMDNVKSENDKKITEDDADLADHLGRLEKLPIFSSPHNSDSSLTAKSEDEENGRSGSSPNSNGEIPIDRENPRRCLACSKVFQNHFGVKTHYQNVHLKNGFDHSLQLMHKCTVDGCNAAFPSKRSRDRHSANLNLHRKLLSTSDASNGSSTDLNSKDRGHGHSLSNSGLFNPYLFQNGSSGAGALGLPNQAVNSPLGSAPPWNPFLPYHMFPAVFGTPPSNGQDGSSFVDCRFCGESFEDGNPLILHMQTAHPHEGLRCRGCSLVFFSRKKYESHSKACNV